MIQTSTFKVITLQEWQTCTRDDVRLRPEDHALAQSVSGTADSRIGLDDLRSGLRISARSWVGVVRFTDFELRIIPKLAGDDLGLLRLVDYTTGMRALDRHPTDHTFSAKGASLFDLVVLLFAEAMERLTRGGLLAAYRETEDDLGVMRGRLRVREQVTRRFGRVDRLECRFDEHTTDCIDNQILLAALTVAVRRVSDAGVAIRVRRLLGIIEEACTLDGFDLSSTRLTLSYTRQNEHYRLPHQLAGLIFDGLGIDDLYTGGGHRTFAFLLDMNRLFEDFVERWLTMLLRKSGYVATPQRRDRTILWNADTERPHASVIPDLVVERSNQRGRFLPVDAKYKLYDGRKISSGDIYQSFLYAFAYGRAEDHLSRGLIIYPTPTDGSPSHRLHIRQQGKHPKAELLAVGINLPAALAEAVENRLGHFGTRIMENIQSSLSLLD